MPVILDICNNVVDNIREENYRAVDIFKCLGEQVSMHEITNISFHQVMTDKDIRPDVFYQIYRKLDKRGQYFGNGINLFPHVPPMLKLLDDMGVDYGYCTNLRPNQAQKQAYFFNLNHTHPIEAVHDDDPHCKPHPKYMLKLLEQLRMDTPIVVIGDSPSDTHAGQNLEVVIGMPVITIRTIMRGTHMLNGDKPDYRITPDQLTPLLANLYKQ